MSKTRRPRWSQAFALDEGETEILEDGNRVALIRVDRIIPADLEGQVAADATARLQQRMNGSLQTDIFDYYARAIQAENGISINQSAVAAIGSQM